MALRSCCRRLAAQVARLKHCVNDCTRNVSGSGLSLARIKPLHEPAGVFARSSRWHRRSWHLCVRETRPSGAAGDSSWTLAWGVMGELTCRFSVNRKHWWLYLSCDVICCHDSGSFSAAWALCNDYNVLTARFSFASAFSLFGSSDERTEEQKLEDELILLLKKAKVYCDALLSSLYWHTGITSKPSDRVPGDILFVIA